jgi:trehalose 6-phosphate phosphatase
MLRPSPQHTGLSAERLAFFLDVDGTLLEIAPAPDAVVVEPALLELLGALVERSHGAVALVSGRAITTLDQFFDPLVLPVAGLHGFERRTADGTYLRKPLPAGELLAEARAKLKRLVSEVPDLLLEDKRFSLALHYRRVPHLEAPLLVEVSSIVAELGPQFELQRGRCVAEIRPASANKAAAIAEFMEEEPFCGRRPLCLGDDITDECAFDWVNRAGGLSIAVGVERDSHAKAHLHSVGAARMWLQRIVEAA